MTASDLLAALDLPAAARVDRRVPKTLLYEHGASTSADKRYLGEGIEQLVWAAALKPATVGVAEYRDDVREYLEIAVLHAELRPDAKAPRLVELVHRAVPYPLLLVAAHDNQAHMSAAHKRWSQGEAGKTMLDGDIIRVDWAPEVDELFRAPFLEALAITRQPRGSLLTLYSGWIDILLTLQAARRTGHFSTGVAVDKSQARREALQACERPEAEIARLRTTAAKEKQMARRVDLNLELKRVEAALTAALAKL